MRWFTNLPVRRKLTAITLASAGAALLVTCTAFMLYDVAAFRSTTVRNLSTQALIVARQSTSALVFRDPDAAAATLDALRADPHVVSAGIYAPDGTLFAAYVREGAPDAVPRPPAGRPEGHAFEGRRLVLFRPIVFDGAAIGQVLIESDLSEMATRLVRYAAIAACALLASFGVAHWTGVRMQRAITRPVLHLAETARAVSQRRDYAVRAESQSSDELGLLVRTFNDMLDQIQARDAALQGARDGLERQVDQRTADLQREIADRRLLAQELVRKNDALEEQSRRVQEATRLKSEFLANMSHELRTPLNAIIGFAELMHDAKLGPVSAQHVECLGDILTSSMHLLQLINDVLDLSKVEAGKMDFRPEPVDVAKVAGEVRDILRTLTARKRIAVTADFDAGLGQVVADPAKLKQVLYNYLSNAVKFTPEGGRIAVRTLAEGADHFRLEVEDTGIGIRAEDLSRLFVEFQQLDAGSAKAYAGTGLGLALTKRIVEAQGGRVGVRSAPGQGSLFFAVLPRAPHGPLPVDVSPDRVRPQDEAATILVIEDDEKEREWLVETLSGAGYVADVAASGREALERCDARAYDGITLDLLLPDMAGWEVLRSLRSGGPNQTTPVIVVTVVVEKGIGAGFAIHDYLAKPLRGEELLGALERAGVLPAAGRPILVVDDDDQARKLVETALSALQYRSLGAASGEEGLRLCASERPAAVILDLLMPGMDGFEFLDRLRSLPSGRSTPVIVWTAKDLTAQDRERLSSAPAVVAKREGSTRSLIDELRACVGRPAGRAEQRRVKERAGESRAGAEE